MKLRYIGGNLEEVRVRKDPKGPRNQTETVQRDQLSQDFEGTRYFWPKPNSVLSVPPNIGGWLLGKQKKFLEEIPEDPADTSHTPRVVVATVPEDVKQPEHEKKGEKEKPAQK